MQVWIALLRGINVGGHRKVPMAELREVCARVGFTSVATYIQSGNVVVRAEGDADAVAARLARGIHDRFGFDVPVVVRSAADLERIVDAHPFAGSDRDPKALHVGFLDEAPPPERVASMPPQPEGPEEFRVDGTEVFLWYPDGMGNSKLTGAWFERVLGVAMTARNWRTVNRLLEMAREA